MGAIIGFMMDSGLKLSTTQNYSGDIIDQLDMIFGCLEMVCRLLG